jgi:hypothetical protein
MVEAVDTELTEEETKYLEKPYVTRDVAEHSRSFRMLEYVARSNINHF